MWTLLSERLKPIILHCPDVISPNYQPLKCPPVIQKSNPFPADRSLFLYSARPGSGQERLLIKRLPGVFKIVRHLKPKWRLLECTFLKFGFNACHISLGLCVPLSPLSPALLSCRPSGVFGEFESTLCRTKPSESCLSLSLSSLSFPQTGSSLSHTLLKTKLPITTKKQPDGTQLSIRSSWRFSRGSAEKIFFVHFITFSSHLSNFGWGFIVSVWKVIWFCNHYAYENLQSYEIHIHISCNIVHRVAVKSKIFTYVRTEWWYQELHRHSISNLCAYFDI